MKIDPRTGETTEGFREKGFVPGSFINMLAMLGWNDGTEQEIFSLDELVQKFSIERVHKGGAKFDYEKARWYNHQYLQRMSDAEIATLARPYVEAHGGQTDDAYLTKIAALIKDRLTLLGDFWEHSHFFFQTPENIDLTAVKDKWNDTKKAFFESWINELDSINTWNHDTLEQSFNAQMEKHGLKKGDVLLPLRIMLVGGKYGPSVFLIAELIGKEETVKRINTSVRSAAM